jgi:hypothetical protein
MLVCPRMYTWRIPRFVKMGEGPFQALTRFAAARMHGTGGMLRSWRGSRFSLANLLARTGLGIGMVVICLVTGCVRSSATRQTLTAVLRLETGIRPTDLQSADTVRGRFF